MTTTRTTKQVGHTPGPWTVGCPRGPLDHYYIMVGGHTIVAKLPSPNIWGDNVVNGIVDDTLLIGNDRERAANARLIAAAPELLEALRSAEFALFAAWQMLSAICDADESTDRIKARDNAAAELAKVRAAISRATQP